MTYWFEFTIRLAVFMVLYVAVCGLGGVDMHSDTYKVGGAAMGLLGGLVLQCKMQLESQSKALRSGQRSVKDKACSSDHRQMSQRELG